MDPTSQTATAGAGVPADVSLLEVSDLRVEFRLRLGVVEAVAGLSYSLRSGEMLAIVGESGSGKTAAAHAVLGVLNTPPGFVTGGTVRLLGRDLLAMPEGERQGLRGRQIAMVAQNVSLNPMFSVGWQVAEPFRVHRGMSRRAALGHAAELLERVGIPSARRRLRDYPHQFSGGMRQRVGIAMAMALDPAVLIADEPTTSLDVTVQAQIMELFNRMRVESGTGLILITHDLGLVSEFADRIVVMYAGRECETGSTEDVFGRPAHPYTRGLLDSIPDIDIRQERLRPIAGAPPDLMRMPTGCPFQPRCAFTQPVCRSQAPQPRVVGPGRRSSCHRAEEILELSRGR